MRGRLTGNGVPRAGAGFADAAARAFHSQPTPHRPRVTPREPSPALAEARRKAGERYAAAVAEMLDALVDLAAIEGVMPAGGREQVAMRTFAAHRPDELAALRHREFVPRAPRQIRAAVNVRKDEMRARGWP